jgi:predicted MFS family arabinose efflux permease
MVGPALVGTLVAADGFGHLAGAAMMASTRAVRFHGRYFAFGSIIVLLASAAYVWSSWYSLAFVILFVSGLGQAGFSTMQSSIMMLVSPPEMRGQMMGLLSFCIGVANLTGALEISFIVAVLGLQNTISLHALAGLALLVPAMAFTPLIKRPLAQPEPSTAT